MMNTAMAAAMAKHLTIPASINNIHELEEASRALSEELLRIADATVPRRKPNTGTTALWWDDETKRAVKDVRRAERIWRTQRSRTAKKELRKAERYRDKVISKAQTRCWRGSLDETATNKDPKAMWNIERWARLRSHQPPEPPAIPALQATKDTTPNGPQIAITHAEKTRELSKRFFPAPEADLSKLKDLDWRAGSFLETILMDWKVKDSDVKEVIRRVGALKALGPDGIFNGLLKTCDKDGRLSAILAKIT